MSEKMHIENKSALKTIDELQPELGNLALFGLERSEGDLSWHWQDVGELISGKDLIVKSGKSCFYLIYFFLFQSAMIQPDHL